MRGGPYRILAVAVLGSSAWVDALVALLPISSQAFVDVTLPILVIGVLAAAVCVLVSLVLDDRELAEKGGSHRGSHREVP